MTPTKKRFHPDGLHLSSSQPKRVYSSSDSGSFADSADDRAACSGTTTPSSLASALNSNCSMIFADSEQSSFGFRNHGGAASSSQDTIPKGGGGWSCNPEFSKQNWMDTEAEVSEVTYDKSQKWHTYVTSPTNSDGRELNFINTRLQDSKKDNIGFLNSRSEARIKTDVCSHNTSHAYGYPQDKDHPHSSIAESSRPSYKEFGDLSFMEERRKLMQKIPTSDASLMLESSSSIHTIANPFKVASRSPFTSPCREAGVEETVAHFGQSGIDKSSDPQDSVNAQYLDGDKVEDSRPSYVLSSGRLSLEEEAKLGRRAPTIDQDFEEYFSTLML